MNTVDLLRIVNIRQNAIKEAGRLYRDRLAPDFNLFDFIEPDEMRLSRILCWLMDPRGSHGQGGRFLHLFVTRLFRETPGSVWSLEVCEKAETRTEFTINGGRRIDVLVTSGNRVLAIENKAGAADGSEQLASYAAYLDGLHQTDTHLIYLTPDGSGPSKKSIDEEQRRDRIESRQLHLWSYREHILEWLTDCRAVCRADRVLMFIDEFSKYIRRNFEGIADMTMHDHLADAVTKTGEMVSAAMQVIAAAEAIQNKLLSALRDQVDDRVVSEGWVLKGNLSASRRAFLYIEFSKTATCNFGVGFEPPKFFDFSYGMIKKDPTLPDDGGVREAIYNEIGHGRGDTKEPWPWWRYTSLQDALLPYERSWRASEQPWAAIPDGTMANSIMGAARRFRDALSNRGLLQQ